MSERGEIKYWNPDMTLDMVRHALGDICIVKITVAGKESVHDLTGVIAEQVHQQITKKLKQEAQPKLGDAMKEEYEIGDEPTQEYSPYAVCYDISGSNERPSHKNWVVPGGTTVLVDFDSPVRKALQDGYLLAKDRYAEPKKASL